MLQMNQIPDVNKLEQTVRESTGNVYLMLPDDDRINLKDNDSVWKYMKAVKPETMNLSFEDPGDVMPFMALLMGTKYVA